MHVTSETDAASDSTDCVTMRVRPHLQDDSPMQLLFLFRLRTDYWIALYDS
jgi:hypothetical protein